VERRPHSLEADTVIQGIRLNPSIIIGQQMSPGPSFYD